jgi:hypothetical protein
VEKKILILKYLICSWPLYNLILDTRDFCHLCYERSGALTLASFLRERENYLPLGKLMQLKVRKWDEVLSQLKQLWTIPVPLDTEDIAWWIKMWWCSMVILARTLLMSTKQKFHSSLFSWNLERKKHLESWNESYFI